MPHVTLKVQQLSTVFFQELSYIDGTKDWKMMKKLLRFQMPHVPLKVLQYSTVFFQGLTVTLMVPRIGRR